MAVNITWKFKKSFKISKNLFCKNTIDKQYCQ